MRNRGELAEGWYDPTTLEKARSSTVQKDDHRATHSPAPPKDGADGSEDSDFGPAAPSRNDVTTHQRHDHKQGPSHASIQDLQVKRELAAEEAEETRRRGIESIRAERRADRHLQKERLDEIAPRAEAGTRERQLEKKHEKADSNRAYAAAAHDHTDAEIKDSDLMGDGGGIDDLKRMKHVEARKRSEREMRRDENLAARRVEREGRVQAMREKEEKTMGMLQKLAKARFGGED